MYICTIFAWEEGAGQEAQFLQGLGVGRDQDVVEGVGLLAPEQGAWEGGEGSQMDPLPHQGLAMW